MKNDEPSFLRLEREVELKVVCPPLLSEYKRLQFENQKLRFIQQFSASRNPGVHAGA